MDLCLEWKQLIVTWEEEWQHEELMLDARAMLAATPGISPASAAETPPAPGVPSWQEPGQEGQEGSDVQGQGRPAAAVPRWQVGAAT